MKIGIFMVVLIVCLHFIGTKVLASDLAAPEMKCQPGIASPPDSGGVCADPASSVIQEVPERSLLLLLPLLGKQEENGGNPRTTAANIVQARDSNTKTIVFFFWGKGCPHCEEEKPFLEGLKRDQPSLEIRDYEVWYNKENAGLMSAMLRLYGVRSSGVPVTFVHDQVFAGFTEQNRASIAKAIRKCILMQCNDPAERLRKNDHPERDAHPRPFVSETTGRIEKTEYVNIPFLGSLVASGTPLPLLTMVIAGMDSFNPCAFFVLLSLLGLLVHAESRNKMFLVGGIFVFFSGFIYFLFMAAWLNLFLVMGHVAVITMIAGAVSMVMAGINIKDFFLFKQGVSLTIPDSAKPKLFDRMRKLLRSTSLVSILIGATVLAVVANFYELLCTAGFPMVFTRILTLNNLSETTYYLYLVLYNAVYVVPLFIIVIGFTFTLGRQKLSEWQGRVLKLVSGTMMLELGAVLLVNPALLNSLLVSFIILLSALGISLLVAAVTKKRGMIKLPK